ncbi:MAG: hypothetical protein AAF560_16175 [Acidobacteriota bacterium]
MPQNPQLQRMIEALQGLMAESRIEEGDLGTLLWLMNSSEHCHQTLETFRPSPAALEALCNRVGDPARAWVQFSPAACELLNGPRNGDRRGLKTRARKIGCKQSRPENG